MVAAAVRASAPGKVILFGEHAVVFGEPAVALAVDLWTVVSATPAGVNTIDHTTLDAALWPYLAAAVRAVAGLGPVDLHVESQIPMAVGLGSSAAVTVATLGALRHLQGAFDPPAIARLAFEVEHEVQGRASPIDTSTAAHGGAILVDRRRHRGFLWRIEKGDRRWNIHDLYAPDLTLVLGNTGVRAGTGALVAKVKQQVEADPIAQKAIRRIGEVTREGVEALMAGDLARVGRLMIEDHRLLNTLGVGHPMLDRLVEAALPHSYGAKLTGAGAGGNMVALSDDPEAAAKAIAAAGGETLTVRLSRQGVHVET